MLTVTKRFDFCYAHHLPNYEGKCANLHGHNAVLEVEVSGPPKGEEEEVYETMVVDFGDLKRIVQQEIIEEVDHKDLNAILRYPTAEAFCEWAWNKLKGWFGERLVRVRMYETPDSWAEMRR